MAKTSEQSQEILQDQQAREAYFTASQRQLVWARFKKQRAAMTAAIVLVVLVGWSFLFKCWPVVCQRHACMECVPSIRLHEYIEQRRGQARPVPRIRFPSTAARETPCSAR